MFTRNDILAQELSLIRPKFQGSFSGLEELAGHTRNYSAGVDILHGGQLDPPVYVLREGWACSYRMLSSGERQIIGFHVQGDILGVRTILLRRSDSDIQSITKIRVAKLAKSGLMEAMNVPSEVRDLLRRETLRNENMLIERLTNLGRRNASERMVLFLLECWSRLQRVGLAHEAGFACPLSQHDLADALGMTAVHVNRVLRGLRKDKFLTFRKGQVQFHCLSEAIEMSGFNPSYLDCNLVAR